MVSRQAKFCDLDLMDVESCREVVRLSSFWYFEGAGGGRIIDERVVEQLLLRYTRKHDVVLDLFLGGGTVLFEAAFQKRRCIGVDIDQACVERVREKLPLDLGGGAVVLQGDSSRRSLRERVKAVLREEMDREYGQFVLLHPPYYRDYVARGDGHERAGDLGLAQSVNAYLNLFEHVARRAYELLEPGRFAALVIGDSYYRGDLVPISSMCLLRMLRVGFHVKCWNVKNWEKYSGTELRMWEGRALAGGFNVFEHEHVVIFRKPARGGKVCYCYG